VSRFSVDLATDCDACGQSQKPSDKSRNIEQKRIRSFSDFVWFPFSLKFNKLMLQLLHNESSIIQISSIVILMT